MRPLRIWIDLDNTPHVLFFEPIVRELRDLGHRVVITGRRFKDTVPVARSRVCRCG